MIDFKFFFDDFQAHRMAVDHVCNDAVDSKLNWVYQTYYQYARPMMPLVVRQWLQRRTGPVVAENWFQPDGLFDHLACMTGPLGAKGNRSLWPNDSRFGFVLTHDVETAVGFRNIAHIADMEEAMGYRSSWNLVPYAYKIDYGLVKDLQQRGFEIGVHGYNHDGKLFTSLKMFRQRVPLINKAIDQLRAVGFRAPMVHRNLLWLQELNIEYDASCFDVDPYQANPGGVGMIWPFIAGKFVELPYTLPQDHTLFVKLGETCDRIWRQKLEFLIRHQGMALMLTHPDYMTDECDLRVYRNFLEHVRSMSHYWHAIPGEVARWWRQALVDPADDTGSSKTNARIASVSDCSRQ